MRNEFVPLSSKLKRPALGVSYLGNRLPGHMRNDLAQISEVCDYVVYVVNETDLLFHKNVLSQIFEESRKRNLEVWADPWGVGGVFGGEALSRYLLEHRDAWQVLSNGRIVPAACPRRPEFRRFIEEWILNVRDWGAQVVFWDEPHLYFELGLEVDKVFACACSLCRVEFKKRFGPSIPTHLTPEVRLFRLEVVKNFLKEVMAFAHKEGLTNALCIYAFQGHSEYDQAWEEAVSLAELDIFGCDPYWRWGHTKVPREHVANFSQKTVASARTHGKASQIWIQAMRFPQGTEGEIQEAVRTAEEAGVEYLAAWSFDGGAVLDPVLSENPPAVWEAVKGAFRMIKGSSPVIASETK